MNVAYDPQKAHYVVVTGILVREGRYLIVRRAPHEKAFPGRWTVPGGKLEMPDYTKRPRDVGEFWYNVFEEVVRREVQEEVGLEIQDIGYVASMIYLRSDDIPCIIVSLYGAPVGTEIRLCNALTEYAWVTLEEAKQYDLIEGIYDELVMLDEFLKTGKQRAWKKT